MFQILRKKKIQIFRYSNKTLKLPKLESKKVEDYLENVYKTLEESKEQYLEYFKLPQEKEEDLIAKYFKLSNDLMKLYISILEKDYENVKKNNYIELKLQIGELAKNDEKIKELQKNINRYIIEKCFGFEYIEINHEKMKELYYLNIDEIEKIENQKKIMEIGKLNKNLDIEQKKLLIRPVIFQIQLKNLEKLEMNNYQGWINYRMNLDEWLPIITSIDLEILEKSIRNSKNIEKWLNPQNNFKKFLMFLALFSMIPLLMFSFIVQKKKN